MTKASVKNKATDKPQKSGIFKFLIFAGVFYLVFFVIVFFSFKTQGSNDLDRTQFCYDYWNMFDEQQISEINSYCKEIQNKTGLTIFVSTCERKSYGTGNYDINSYYAEMNGDEFRIKNNIDYNDNCALIIINAQKDKSTQSCFDFHFDLYTYGEAYKKISDSEIDNILFSEGGDLILTSDTTNAVEGIKQCVKLTSVAYKWIIPHASWFTICLIAIIISSIISLIIVLSIRKSYTRERNNETFAFATNSNLNLSVNNDNYIRSTTTYIRIQNNNSFSGRSGGGHSGGGHSGGGHSGGGGGGGHRGGR